MGGILLLQDRGGLEKNEKNGENLCVSFVAQLKILLKVGRGEAEKL